MTINHLHTINIKRKIEYNEPTKNRVHYHLPVNYFLSLVLFEIQYNENKDLVTLSPSTGNKTDDNMTVIHLIHFTC